MPPITELAQLDLTKSYNYADYLTWKFPEYVELFRGQVVLKPTPWTVHQQVVGSLLGIVSNYARRKPVRVFHRPFDVRLPHTADTADAAITTVVQPDLSVFLTKNRVDGRGAVGAPDWVIEVISPKTARYDTTVKAALYAENGVREYWIVFPNEQIVQVFALQGEDYKLAGVYSEPGLVPSLALPELALEWADVFEGLLE